MKKPFGEILRDLRDEHNCKQSDLVDLIGQMGIEVNNKQVSRWERGYNKPNIEQFLALCFIYSIHDAWKVFMNWEDMPAQLNEAGMEKLREYKKLLIASHLYDPAPVIDNVIEFPKRYLPLYDVAVSAGPGQFLDESGYNDIEVPAEVPACANYALTVSGDSMEPTLHDGDIIWVCTQPDLNNGEIGVFLHDGNSYVKEFRRTEEGELLISHNPDYAPIPLTCPEDRIFGKVVWPLC